MTQQSPIHKLSSLTHRQREVLHRVCDGLSYKSISDQFVISENTVKAHMGNIYVKLGLDGLPPAERRKTLHQVFCPALSRLETHADVLEKAEEPEEPDPVPEVVWEMVEEDERAIILMPPRDIIDLSPRPNKRQPSRRRWLLFGMLLGSLLTICAAFAAWRAYGWIVSQLNLGEPLPITQASDEPIDQPSEVAIVPPTTSAPSATIAPATQELIVVTATPPPTIPTSTQPLLPSPTPSLQPTEAFIPPPDGILFFDDFNSGLKSEWEVMSGKPVISNGGLSATEDTWLIVGDPRWQNYIVEFDGVRNQAEMYLGVHVHDLGNMAAFQWHFDHSGWYLVEDGDWASVEDTKVFRLGGKTGPAKITVENNQYSATVFGRDVGSFWEATFSMGRVAINLDEWIVIDNFKITWLP